MQLQTINRAGFTPTNITDAMKFCEMLADSNMVPKDYVGKPQNILVAIQWGMELGLAPMQSLQNITVINGRPSIWGDALMALVQASPVCEDIQEYLEGEGTTNTVAVCIAKRKGRSPVTERFSTEDAKKAGLWTRPTWASYPNRMLQMRARGFALRGAFADVLKGIITAEEAQDYPDEAKPVPVAKPANPLDLVAKPVEIAITEPAVVEPELEDFATATVATVATVAAEAEEMQPVVQTDGLPIGYGLWVPGKQEPHSVHDTLDEWADAYEDLAEKTAKAGKRPARERMTILKELKECNAETLGRIDTMKRVRHTAGYQRRINALGAAQ